MTTKSSEVKGTKGETQAGENAVGEGATRITRDAEKLWAAIKDIRIAMLSTIDPDGVIRSRPMGTQEASFDGSLWFFTKRDSGKVHSIENDQHVNLAYANVNDQKYVSVAGHAQMVDDREKMKELWSPMLKAWFPDGLEDPELGLIRVDVDSAEIWDSPSSTFVQLVGFAKAVATGKAYDHSSDHKRIDLSTH